MGRKNIRDKNLKSKIIKVFIVAAIGLGLGLIIFNNGSKKMTDDSMIIRSSDGREKNVVLYANSMYGKERVRISVIPQGGIQEDDEDDYLSSPKQYSESELFYQDLEDAIQQENERNLEEDSFVLPSNVNGVNVTWKKDNDKRIIAIPVLVFIISFWILFKDRITRADIEKKRREKLLSEYPSFALRYALLNEAGLTHMQTLEKLGQYYINDPSCGELYRLVNICVNSIKGGMSIYEALDMLSNECGVREISRFLGIIKRNIRKGGSDLAIQLKSVARESEEISRERIRKNAETASTRLLMPMMILLLIVFVVIMIPAFANFYFR